MSHTVPKTAGMSSLVVMPYAFWIVMWVGTRCWVQSSNPQDTMAFIASAAVFAYVAVLSVPYVSCTVAPSRRMILTCVWRVFWGALLDTQLSGASARRF